MVDMYGDWPYLGLEIAIRTLEEIGRMKQEGETA